MLNVIDISSYQAGLKISAVPADGVIVKATQSNNYINPFFKSHANATLSAGKLLGVYHFFDATVPVANQVAYFLKVVKPYLGKAILCLDFENTAGSNVRNNTQVARAYDFVTRIKAKTGVRMILYTNLDFENHLNFSAFVANNYALWIAQYDTMNVQRGFKVPTLTGKLVNFKSYAIHQYSSAGRLNGYSGDLDLDIFYGDRKAWLAYAKTSTPAPTPKNDPKWVKENATYITNTVLYIRASASTSAKVLAVLPAYSTIKTDQAIITGGYRWVRQPRSGGYGYITTGPVGHTLNYVTKH